MGVTVSVTGRDWERTMATKKISFSHPIGTEFHNAVNKRMKELKDKQISATYADIAADSIEEGLRLLLDVGVMSENDRMALVLEVAIKKKDPNAKSVTINYTPRDSIADLVQDCMAATTLNGPRKVLKEALVLYLRSNGGLPAGLPMVRA